MSPNSDPHKTITYTKIVDLSHIIDPNIPLWPSDPAIKFETVAELQQDGYYLRRFSIGEHSATHMNAPNSFHADGIGIDAYPAASLVVPAVVINIQEKTAINADYALTKSDVLNWEQQHQPIAAGNVVLLRTGWQAKWQDHKAFFNQDAQGKMHFPGFGGDTTQFLLEERGIAGIGIDTHGVDPGHDETLVTNKQVLEQPRIVLENLTNLEQLPPMGITLVIGILRLKNGSGTPASVLAFVP